ncbi:hypothetical protein SAMN04489835_0980 [Mycolicibacterium rutilum]|uniref:Integral membrane protein n=1 Tax=Mycolicibacterium rutilum TaxID=370526 RepID=A0A1H6IU02_MYCRU|nr:hypothetical protein [Mycolicibacterium rutilum]SEH52732.1 hypothetical protein SAMN04489835_0980 [Mycolicibacterium rutilum]
MNRLLSTAAGLVMVAAAALSADTAALWVCAGAAAAVVAGTVVRAMSTAAVLLVAVALVLAGAAAAPAAVCGLTAAGYLVLRHTAEITAPTAMAMAGFALAALAAVAIPLRLPWAPLAAPLVVLAVVVLATRPLWADRLHGRRN